MPKATIKTNTARKPAPKNSQLKTDPVVSRVLSKEKRWHDEMQKLRMICLECGLTEQLKWGQACYTTEDNKNIVLIHGFKEYCALLFMKGALMRDPEGLLIQQTENVQAARQIRFSHLDEIVELEPIVKKYIKHAIEIENAGLKVQKKETAEYKMPAELEEKLADDARFKKAFGALTPGRQRGYILFFAQPKQPATRYARIEKMTPKILKGKGYLE